MKWFSYMIASGRMFLLVSFLALHYTRFRMLRPFKKDSRQWGLCAQQKYARVAVRILGICYSVEGQIPDQPALLVSNHRSFLDPLIILSEISAMAVAKAEVREYFLIGRAAEKTGVIYVRREDRTSRTLARDSIVDQLQQGISVLVFPEGTVSTHHKTIEFRMGSFQKAIEADVDIIPIALHYDQKFYWHHNSLVQYYFQSIGWNRIHVKMKIGPCLRATSALSAMNKSKKMIDNYLMTFQNEVVSTSQERSTP